jgi:hypothetical protein
VIESKDDIPYLDVSKRLQAFSAAGHASRHDRASLLKIQAAKKRIPLVTNPHDSARPAAVFLRNIARRSGVKPAKV